MDGVGDDFSGLPERKTRAEKRSERLDRRYEQRRANPYRGRRTRVLLAIGFAMAVMLVLCSLIVLFAPTPYLGTNHAALSSSVGGSAGKACHPGGDGWICSTGSGSADPRYRVNVDWAGCWSGRLIGPGGVNRASEPNISGCVALIDHLRAD